MKVERRVHLNCFPASQAILVDPDEKIVIIILIPLHVPVDDA